MNWKITSEEKFKINTYCAFEQSINTLFSYFATLTIMYIFIQKELFIHWPKNTPLAFTFLEGKYLLKIWLIIAPLRIALYFLKYRILLKENSKLQKNLDKFIWFYANTSVSNFSILADKLNNLSFHYYDGLFAKSEMVWYFFSQAVVFVSLNFWIAQNVQNFKETCKKIFFLNFAPLLFVMMNFRTVKNLISEQQKKIAKNFENLNLEGVHTLESVKIKKIETLLLNPMIQQLIFSFCVSIMMFLGKEEASDDANFGTIDTPKLKNFFTVLSIIFFSNLIFDEKMFIKGINEQLSSFYFDCLVKKMNLTSEEKSKIDIVFDKIRVENMSFSRLIGKGFFPFQVFENCFFEITKGEKVILQGKQSKTFFGNLISNFYQNDLPSIKACLDGEVYPLANLRHGCKYFDLYYPITIKTYTKKQKSFAILRIALKSSSDFIFLDNNLTKHLKGDDLAEFCEEVKISPKAIILALDDLPANLKGFRVYDLVFKNLKLKKA